MFRLAWEETRVPLTDERFRIRQLSGLVGFHPSSGGPFLDPDSMIRWKITKFLHEAARPLNGGLDWICCASQTEDNVFTVLAKKTGTCLEHLRLATE